MTENKDQKVTFQIINGKRYALVDGKPLKTEEGFVKNWGSFFDWLTKYWYEFDAKRQEEKNPYRQYVLNEQKDMIKASRKEYENFLGLIAGRKFEDHNDVAKPYLEYLEKRINEVTEESKQVGLPDYFYPAFRGKIKVLKKILNQFKGFILAP